MKFVKLEKNFPIYLMSNFEQVEYNFRIALMGVVLENKYRNHFGKKGGSFPISEDYRNFFKNLYHKFTLISKELFGNFEILSSNNQMCWSYASNKFDHGPGNIHNHLNSSTINSVYYLNVPQSATIKNGSITFFMNQENFSYRPKNGDLLLFPNYLNHKINFLDDEEYRISINMEIKCRESSYSLFSNIK